jgi:hypothetical protein
LKMKGSENRVFRFAVEKNALNGIFRGPLEPMRRVSGSRSAVRG